MYHYILNHGLEYLLIYVIFATSVWTLMSAIDPVIKGGLIIGLSGIYFLWAVWHHIEDHKRIDFEVLMEYVSVLVLVTWVLFSLI